MPEYINNQDVYINEFNKIYNETFNDLRKYIAVRCSDINYILDILQETYFDYYKIIAKKGTGYVNNPISILFKIAKRKIYRYYSLKEKLKKLIPNIQKNKNNEEYLLTDEQDVYKQDIDGKVLENIEAERLWKIINSYSADTRKIIYLYFYEDLTLAEIAKNIGFSLSKVKHRLYRTLEEIRNNEQSKEQNNE